MPTEIRFGAFAREIAAHHDEISYNEITPKPALDAEGNEVPYRAPKIRLRGIDVYRLLQPYIAVRLLEQLRAVLPLSGYLVLFQILILREGVLDAGIITAGLIAVIIGLTLFMEGLKVGLMPFGELMGTILPAKAQLHVVLSVALLLGIGVTFAEPAIGALKAAGQIVQVEDAPYLYALLNEWAEALVLVVGLGVGAAAVLGTLRFLNGWSLKPLIYLTLIPTMGLTLYISADPELSKMLGLAWDSGAVTTGPVTVPLVLSLGIGIAAAAGRGNDSLSGFGIVTLASLFPIIGVLSLALVVSWVTTPEAIIEAAMTAAAAAATAEPAWYQRTPYAEILGGLRAILPLVIFLFVVLRLLLKERLAHPAIIAYGISLAVLGMIVFNLGLTYGLAKLGGQSGSLVPGAFSGIPSVADSPLYAFSLGLLIALAFAWFLGFGATLAEPALNALGLTVENLTNGAFRKRVLMIAVSLGVGFGIALGVSKIIFNIPIVYFLLPGYTIAVILTYFSTEEFVNVAWDSAGVTTGPVTVPLVLAMGLGFGNAVEAIEGFGILSMASICPIISVLVTGLWIRWKVDRRHRKYDQDKLAATHEVAR
jgi:hypothetical protein